MGKMETWVTPSKIKTREHIDTQFVRIDYVTRGTLVPNLVKIRSRGTSGQMGEI